MNRDYKSNDRRVTRNLRIMTELTQKFEIMGLHSEEASVKAYYFVLHPIEVFTLNARSAIREV